MIDVAFIKATEAHARELAQRMRPKDVEEVDASHGLPPLAAILMSMRDSDASVAMLMDGEVACIFGVVPAGPAHPNVGCVWLLTGEAVSHHPLPFLRSCRPMVRELLNYYPVLCARMDASYTKAVRWAKWLGFEVRNPESFGARRKPFHEIVLRRN